MPSEAAADPGWLTPQWPAVAGVSALFTSRTGGVSAPPFDSFNLGDHVRDAPEAVAANRERLAAHLGGRPVFLRQVHGTHTVVLAPLTPDGTEADACVSDTPGLVCTIMVADCLPVLLAHRSGRVVAAAHAGWRGLLGQGGVGVIEACWQVMAGRLQALLGLPDLATLAAETQVWLGPCIGPQAFEVGPEVRAAFVADQSDSAQAFRPGAGGRWWANLPALARQRLARLGLNQVYGNDGGDGWCTVAQPSRFFSHRRDAVRLGSTGRMAACIWRG